MTSHLRFKEKTSKTAFEARLVKEFGAKNISASKHAEAGADDYGNPIVTMMVLYYHTDRGHIGTWMKGKGWVFESAYAG